MAHFRGRGGLTATAFILAAGCQSSLPTASTPETEGVGGPTLQVHYANPPFDPSNFVPTITNRYLPLTPGTTFHYRTETSDGVELNDVSVTRQTKTILGVRVTVV